MDMREREGDEVRGAGEEKPAREGRGEERMEKGERRREVHGWGGERKASRSS
mgnify:CR=1 FL=1